MKKERAYRKTAETVKNLSMATNVEIHEAVSFLLEEMKSDTSNLLKMHNAHASTPEDIKKDPYYFGLLEIQGRTGSLQRMKKMFDDTFAEIIKRTK